MHAVCEWTNESAWETECVQNATKSTHGNPRVRCNDKGEQIAQTRERWKGWRDRSDIDTWRQGRLIKGNVRRSSHHTSHTVAAFSLQHFQLISMNLMASVVPILPTFYRLYSRKWWCVWSCVHLSLSIHLSFSAHSSIYISFLYFSLSQ